MIKYYCIKCNKAKCTHSKFFKRPCYSNPRKGMLSICKECHWRFVCITNGDLLEAQYDRSAARDGITS